jgi:hypothetical protein
VDQVVNRPETRTFAGWTLGGVLRTGGLLTAAVLASVLTVDLPIPTSRTADGQGGAQPYVPASDKWIELGVPQRPAASAATDRLQADLLNRAVPSDRAAPPGRAPVRRHVRPGSRDGLARALSRAPKSPASAGAARRPPSMPS